MKVEWSGKVFGRLTVISEASGKKINCRCQCGKLVQIYKQHARSGNTVSCGCYISEYLKLTNNGLDANINRVINRYQNKAKKRGFEWSLTDQEAHDLMTNDCVYCGSSPQQIAHGFKNKDFITLYNGIDRVDSTIGYIMSNCVSCCGQCNIMKHETQLSDWFAHMRKIIQFKSVNAADWELCY